MMDKKQAHEARELLTYCWPESFGIITSTVRDWDKTNPGMALTGHDVAHFLATRYHRDEERIYYIWRAVADVADAEIWAMSRRPESLVGALAGLDDNLR